MRAEEFRGERMAISYIVHQTLDEFPPFLIPELVVEETRRSRETLGYSAHHS